MVHSEACRSVEVPPIGGSRYFIALIYDYSRWTTVYMTKQNRNAVECFEKFEDTLELFTVSKYVSCCLIGRRKYVEQVELALLK